MGSFVDLVQQGTIPNPAQRQYSIDKWDNGYRKIKEPDENDKKLYEAGSWFFERFEKVRRVYNKFDIENLNRTFLLKSICSDINRDTIIALQRFDEHFEDKKGLVIDNLPSVNVGSRLNNFDVDSLIENVVDGARLSITEVQKKDTKGTKKDFEQIFNFVVNSKNIGIYYDSLVNYWKECQWNNWFLKKEEERNSIYQPKNQLEIARSISEHREFTLASEVTGFAIKNWKKIDKRQRLELLKNKKVVKSVDLDSGSIELGTPALNVDKAPQSWPLRLLAEEVYWDDILVADFPKFPGVNIRDILSLWDILHSLGEYLFADLNMTSEVYTEEDLTKYCFWITKSSLNELISKGLSLDKETAKKISKELIFDRDGSRNEIWHKPFVDLKNDTIAPIYPALNSPNMIRYVENWMKVGGLDLGERGILFENYVKECLVEAKEEFKFGKDKVNVFDSSDLSIAKKEEIDLILVIDDLILVGEVKCYLFPTDPLEVHNMVSNIQDGVEQVKRKTKYLKENLNRFLSSVGLDDCKDYQVINCIITNRGLGVGLSYQGVPVTDLKILAKYIESDHLPLFYEIQSHSYSNKFQFYTTFRQLKKEFKSYLFLPPQIQSYTVNLRRKEIKFPSLPNDNKSQFASVLKVKFDDLDIQQFR